MDSVPAQDLVLAGDRDGKQVAVFGEAGIAGGVMPAVCSTRRRRKMAVIRKQSGRRVLAAERLERRDMLSGDGLVAAPLAAAPAEAVAVVACDNLQQQTRAGDRDQVQDRVRDYRCAARPALEPLAVQASLGDQLQQREQLQTGDMVQIQQQTRTQSQDTTSSLAAAALASTMDQVQARDRDQLKDGSCDQIPDQVQDRDRTRLQDSQLAAVVSASATSGDQQRDRDRTSDGIQDRDQLQKRDQSCVSALEQSLTELL